MILTKLILGFIIAHIGKTNQLCDTHYYKYEVITFLDRSYPSYLRKYMYIAPVIYYYGNIKALENCAAVILTYSPSFYVQKVLSILRNDYFVIGITISKNSLANITYLYDIIYCNDIKQSFGNISKLTFSFGIELEEKFQLQLVSLIANQLFVLEGYPSPDVFELVSNFIDNNKEVCALPSNIFTRVGTLPNILLENGIGPLLLNEK